ncbi:MAG TPA: ABC transporter [Legionellales bacterium]|nr:ABC transporter [Legionellales bacterium]
MRLNHLVLVPLLLLLNGCHHTCSHPDDPFENINREIYKMNMAFDATLLKPSATLYYDYVPANIRAGINNVFNNVAMLPTIGNDILQLKGHHAINDFARFYLNSTLGLAGIGDVATQLGIPNHRNDFGLTLAHWGNPNSPYIMIPFLGPSTIRDGFGLVVDYTFMTPYPFIAGRFLYGILGTRYVDLRSQMMDGEHLLHDSLDPYIFMRDAYLQYRRNLIGINQGNSSTPAQDTSASLYVPEDDTPLTETQDGAKSSPFPITTALNDSNSPLPA